MAELDLADLAMQMAGAFRAGAQGTRRGTNYRPPDAITQDRLAALFEACSHRIRELERGHLQHSESQS